MGRRKDAGRQDVNGLGQLTSSPAPLSFLMSRRDTDEAVAQQWSP